MLCVQNHGPACENGVRNLVCRVYNVPMTSIYPESMLKGRMAETLFEEMLRAAGNQVYRFGYEAVLQNLSQFERHFNGSTPVGERIRAIPDFIVIDRAGVPAFVEVKFRMDPLAAPHDNTIDTLERVEKYWDALIVFVNAVEKPYFRIARPPYFKNFSIPKRGFALEPLTGETQWGITPEMYEEYERLVEKYLAPSGVAQ